MEKLTYRQFLKTDVELSVLGVMRVEEPFEPYFCTLLVACELEKFYFYFHK